MSCFAVESKILPPNERRLVGEEIYCCQQEVVGRIFPTHVLVFREMLDIVPILFSARLVAQLDFPVESRLTEETCDLHDHEVCVSVSPVYMHDYYFCL